MDSVCRTCMRIIDVNESVISINDTDLREKLQVCFPELVLDNVVDPKMCSTCSAALSLSFRFKGMCYEAEKTINSCIQNKVNEGEVNPLNEIELLTIGRRDMGDIVMGDGCNFVVAEEVEVESSLESNPHTEYLESLQILSDVASQATKAVSPNPTPRSTAELKPVKKSLPCNWEDEIKCSRIERTPRISKRTISKHIEGTIEDVIAKASVERPAKIRILPATFLEASPKKSPVKVVETSPTVDVHKQEDKTKTVCSTPKSNKRTPKGRKNTKGQKVSHTTGEDELSSSKTPVKLLPVKTPTTADKKQADTFKKARKLLQNKVGKVKLSPVQSKAEPKVVQSQRKTPKTKAVAELPVKKQEIQKEIEVEKSSQVVSVRTTAVVSKENKIDSDKLPPKKRNIKQTIDELSAKSELLVSNKMDIQENIVVKDETVKANVFVASNKAVNVKNSPIKVVRELKFEHGNPLVTQEPIKTLVTDNKINLQTLVKEGVVIQLQKAETNKILDELAIDIEENKLEIPKADPIKHTKISPTVKVEKMLLPTEPKKLKTEDSKSNVRISNETKSQKAVKPNVSALPKCSIKTTLKTETPAKPLTKTPLIKPKTVTKTSAKTPLKAPKVKDDVADAIAKLLQTPEYQQLLQLQAKSEDAAAQKLEKLDKTIKQLVPDKVKAEAPKPVKRKLVVEPKSVPLKKIRRLKPRSPRRAKALEEINLDLQEINYGVEQQKLAFANRKSKEREIAAPTNTSETKGVKLAKKILHKEKDEAVTSSKESDVKSVKQIKPKEVEAVTAKNKSKARPLKRAKMLPQSKAEAVKKRVIKPLVKQTLRKNRTLINKSGSRKVKRVPPSNSEAKKGSVLQEIQNRGIKRHRGSKAPAKRQRQRIRKANQTGKLLYKCKKIDGRTLNRKQTPQVCSRCGKIYSCMSRLSVHMRSHVILKSFKCDLCDKSFSLQRYLLLHTMQHFSAGNHQCTLCEKYFSSQHVLRKHELTHTGERPYVCIICSRAFTQKINLNVHMRTHTGIREFICYICNSAFSQKIHLKGHMRTHTGEKPYACDLCPKAFAKSNVLREHKALHILKPYKCDSCHILFKDESGLQRHLTKNKNKNLHFSNSTCPGKVYNCGICSRYFTSKYSRDRHMKVHVKDLIEVTG